jgi:Tol biopolymer transport system component
VTAIPTELLAALADRYRVERQLGRGGMATVYLARDVKHDRLVAIKLLHPELAAVLGAERFLAEIRTTASLQHPHILPLFDSGDVGGQLFYVMPFVDGETLRSRLDRETQLPLTDAIQVAREIADALAYAHDRGVIHRDVKPENILLQGGHALVADFGIALAVQHAGGHRMTQTGLSLGTPQYMAPEQATGEKAVDGRADIYALGAVCYEMLMGEPPFTGPTPQAIIARVLTDTPRSIRATRGTVPAHVEWAITRAMEKLPADRWASAQQFSNALSDAGVMTRAGITTAPADALSSRGLPIRTPIAVAGAVAAATACIAIGAFLHSRIASPAEPQRTPVRFAIALDSNQALGGPNAIAISPDGRTIVYAAATAGGWRKLFVRPVDELKAREIPGTEGAADPFFSPDGRTVGFTSGEGAAFTLKKVSIGGGAPVALAKLDGTFQGASWTRADTIVLSFRNTIATVAAAGGALRTVGVVDSAAGETGQTTPLLLSDGKSVLYSSRSGRDRANARIGVASLLGGKPRRLEIAGTMPLAVVDGIFIYVATNGVVNGVAFDQQRVVVTGAPVPLIDVADGNSVLSARIAPSGSLIYTSGTVASEARLIDLHGNGRGLIPGFRGYSHPRFSPDGKRLALTVNGDIFIYDITAETLTPLTTDGATNDRAEWTSDGKRLVFPTNVGNGAGNQTIRIRSADLSGPAEDLFHQSGIGIGEAMISPNNQYLLIRVSGGKGYREDIVYRQISGDTTLKPLVVTPFNDYGPRISPDGKWVAYSSDASGTDQIWVTPMPGPGPHYQVSTNGGQQPVWSRDGKKIFFTHGDQLQSVTVTFSPFQVTARETLPITGIGGSRVHANYDIAPDGQHFVVFKHNGPSTSAVVVYDWMSEVRARMSVKR